MMSDIMFEHLTKTYPNGFISVDDVTLKIQDGEFVVFHGPSGCGKSTILRMIGGLEDITSGKIYLGDELPFHNFRSVDLPLSEMQDLSR